ncbi:hypothetical protein SZ64_07285 [Erythrobacter sp. SG61-1L]|uniref:hypothetical protein n=1 Tax=Erythrobacter sp. SG61-1L TaxID=1603897 RepID=UPI0006C9050E|nr:hypothetical protein [Erythrobacter sp. SG61-1L]KPL67938.1 hypothetical protein SZ64_07285 [Erythrobacter sp. SG61-1L]
MAFWDGLIFLYWELGAFVRRFWWSVVLLALPDLIYFGLQIIPSSQDWAFWRDGLAPYIWRTAALVLQVSVFYVLIRFLALNRDAQGATRLDPSSIKTFAPFAVFYVFLHLALYFAGTMVELSLAVLGSIVMIMLALWAVSASSGRTVIPPLASCRAVAPNLIWAVGFVIVSLLPLSLLGLLKDAIEHADWAYSTWALRAFFALDLAYSIADILIFFGALYVIANRAGLRIKHADERAEPAPR